ncbi:unnamed protein product [Arabidopsis halleri]
MAWIFWKIRVTHFYSSVVFCICNILITYCWLIINSVQFYICFIELYIFRVVKPEKLEIPKVIDLEQII